MNFSFYIYGTPNGYNQYPADSKSLALQEFAQNNSTESQLTVCRREQLVYCAYIRKLQEKTNSYLGFCLVFNGVYCQNPQKLFSLFDRAFDDVLMKGELLRFEKEKAIFTIGKFTEKPIEIDRLKTFFKNYLESDFIRDFVSVPASFKVGNGKKTLSIRETNSEILAAIREFDCVHLSNSEKSLSELERTHKMLSELYAEKQNLDTKYRKLTVQKKQYRLVLFLCLAVICCAIGLFTFNKNLQNRDSQIRSLNEENRKQQSEMEKMDTIISQLQIEQEELINENSVSTDKIKQMVEVENENRSLKSQNEQLVDKVNEKQKEIDKRKTELSGFEDLRKTFPIKITRIELGNTKDDGSVIDDYGSVLSSSKMRYLSPKIYFTNYLKEGKTFNFTVHYYDSQWKLSYNAPTKERPADQMPTSARYISTTANSATLNGWGTASGGTWKADTYTVEIWSDGVCLGSKKFTIN
jgi:hypothetical protein